jgi:glycosyltransferase involved in cell wall biosynthesis
MAAGRPVVGTLVGCLPELVEPMETGLIVAPGDSVALADALMLLLRNPLKAEKWGNNGHEQAKIRFNEYRFYSQTLELYERAIQQRAAVS